MRLLKLNPEIHKFRSFKEFAEDFNLGKDDFILTHEVIFDSFIKELNLQADFIFQEKYGAEPSDEMINQIISDQKNNKYKRIVAIGGGSVIDIAKILALKDVRDSLEIFDKKAPIIKDKELIIVPTTCGTGSEVTNISIAEIKSRQTKMGLAVDELYAEHAVLIPELLYGLPYKFFLYSSIDALIHAVESYLSPKSNSYTEMYAAEAIRIIIEGYKQIIDKGQNHSKSLIEDFLVASNYAGIAFGNAGVGAVHALSYPLGGVYHVAHGEANYQFFMEVFRVYNTKSPNGKIEKLKRLIAENLSITLDDNVFEELEKVLNKLIEKNKLSSYGMKIEEIELFTDGVIEKQQRLLVNNYVALTRDDILNIYKKLY